MITCYTVTEIWCVTDVIIFHFGPFNKCTKNYDQMMYGSWDIVRDKYNCYFSFWAIFHPFTPLTAPKNKILKKWKKSWRYHHFTYVYQKLWSDDLRFLRYAVRRTDGWKKLHIEVGAPPTVIHTLIQEILLITQSRNLIRWKKIVRQ